MPTHPQDPAERPDLEGRTAAARDTAPRDPHEAYIDEDRPVDRPRIRDDPRDKAPVARGTYVLLLLAALVAIGVILLTAVF
jgi:hypothetical protein